MYLVREKITAEIGSISLFLYHILLPLVGQENSAFKYICMHMFRLVNDLLISRNRMRQIIMNH